MVDPDGLQHAGFGQRCPQLWFDIDHVEIAAVGAPFDRVLIDAFVRKIVHFYFQVGLVFASKISGFWIFCNLANLHVHNDESYTE